MARCPICDGTGETSYVENDSDIIIEICFACSGKGKVKLFRKWYWEYETNRNEYHNIFQRLIVYLYNQYINWRYA
jgi:hypothetical protein